MNQETWEELHAGKLAGSDISAILGLNPFVTQRMVWERITGVATKTEPNAKMKLGLLAEPLIQAALCEVHGLKPELFTAPQPMETTLNGVPIVFSPDRFYGDDTLFEFKFPHHNNLMRGTWKSDGTPAFDATPGCPVYYAIQSLIYAMLTNRPKPIVAAYFGSDDVRCYPVERNPELENTITNEIVEWWDWHIVQGNEPREDLSNADQITRQLERFSGKTVYPASESMSDIAARIMDKTAQVKAIEKEIDSDKVLLLSFVPDGFGAIETTVGKFSVVRAEKGSVSWKTVADKLKPLIEPDQFNEIVSLSTSAPKGAYLKLPTIKEN